MKHLKNILRSGVFLAILVSSLLAINSFLTPKFISRNSIWPTTSTYKQFYQMDKNSIDVLFIGSSVVVNAFIPQEIYNDYGIRSYNLGSEQQSIFLSYYWLKEALRFQKPQAVVLDLKFMGNSHPENPINTVETLTRKALDPMKWSPVKREAVHKLCELDQSQSELSYYLTNIRYHTRWSGMQEYDFDDELVDHAPLMGFAPMTTDGPASYTTYEQKDPTVTTEFVPLMQEYLNLTVDLCKENDIQLILVDLPGNEMNDAINNTRVAYAEKNGIEYYNLCRTDYYNQIGAVLPRENVVVHENIWGAIKTSKFIGGILSEQCGIEPVIDEQYEATMDYYEQTKISSDLVRIVDQAEYLKALNNPNYAVFMAAHGNTSSVFKNDAVLTGLGNLGLACKFEDAPADSYVAAIVGGEVVEEESSSEQLEVIGSFRNRRSIYNLRSNAMSSVAYSSLYIEGVQYTRSVTGLNIAVYDLNTCKVIDRVTLQGAKVVR